jgi:hypothetical protein
MIPHTLISTSMTCHKFRQTRHQLCLTPQLYDVAKQISVGTSLTARLEAADNAAVDARRAMESANRDGDEERLRMVWRCRLNPD